MGQFLDIRFSKSNNKSKEDILHINSYKTSKLFSLCSLIPAIVAQDEYKQKQLGNWGELFGDTFQMLDDKQDINDNKTNLFSVFNDEEFALMLKRNRKKMEEIAKESNILELISLMELIAWGENGI